MREERVLWPGWETVRLIGRGSFGAVYEIRRTVFDETEYAALKVISIPQNDSEIKEMYIDGYDEESISANFQDQLRSIVSEYIMMRRLNGNTNVVNCDDVRYVQREDGIGWDIYIKMELLTPLGDFLSEDITEEMVVKIAVDMCVALELCKKHNIVHRDIKPQNIFVSSNGDYKLGDFGVAKTIERTMGGTKIGTYKYMAPEVHDYKPYGATADIYSLGLVLYWLLNERRMPFLPLPPTKIKVTMEEDAKNRRLAGEPIPMPVHGCTELKQIVVKACAYKPEERFQSATEMLEALYPLKFGWVKPVREVRKLHTTAQFQIKSLEEPFEAPDIVQKESRSCATLLDLFNYCEKSSIFSNKEIYETLKQDAMIEKMYGVGSVQKTIEKIKTMGYAREAAMLIAQIKTAENK